MQGQQTSVCVCVPISSHTAFQQGLTQTLMYSCSFLKKKQQLNHWNRVGILTLNSCNNISAVATAHSCFFLYLVKGHNILK